MSFFNHTTRFTNSISWIFANPEPTSIPLDTLLLAAAFAMFLLLIVVGGVVWFLVSSRKSKTDFGRRFEERERERLEPKPKAGTEGKSLTREQLSAQTVSSSADTIDNGSEEVEFESPPELNARFSSQRTVDATDDQSVVDDTEEDETL
ncbi:MAG: hypothetical protein AAGA30_06240 [Planctomycetota bacterium]